MKRSSLEFDFIRECMKIKYDLNYVFGKKFAIKMTQFVFVLGDSLSVHL